MFPARPSAVCSSVWSKTVSSPIIRIFKGALPYVTCNIIVLIAISVWPALTTWLPLLLGYSL